MAHRSLRPVRPRKPVRTSSGSARSALRRHRLPPVHPQLRGERRRLPPGCGVLPVGVLSPWSPGALGPSPAVHIELVGRSHWSWQKLGAHGGASLACSSHRSRRRPNGHRHRWVLGAGLLGCQLRRGPRATACASSPAFLAPPVAVPRPQGPRLAADWGLGPKLPSLPAAWDRPPPRVEFILRAWGWGSPGSWGWGARGQLGLGPHEQLGWAPRAAGGGGLRGSWGWGPISSWGGGSGRGHPAAPASSSGESCWGKPSRDELRPTSRTRAAGCSAWPTPGPTLTSLTCELMGAGADSAGSQPCPQGRKPTCVCRARRPSQHLGAGLV